MNGYNVETPAFLLFKLAFMRTLMLRFLLGLFMSKQLYDFKGCTSMNTSI